MGISSKSNNSRRYLQVWTNLISIGNSAWNQMKYARILRSCFCWLDPEFAQKTVTQVLKPKSPTYFRYGNSSFFLAVILVWIPVWLKGSIHFFSELLKSVLDWLMLRKFGLHRLVKWTVIMITQFKQSNTRLPLYCLLYFINYRIQPKTKSIR